MKRILIINIAVCISALQVIPAHAMLATAALRTNLLTTGQRFAPTLAENAWYPDLTKRSTLLTRTLATQQQEYSYGHSEDAGYQSGAHDHSYSEQQSWWQRFRARFARSETAPALGASLFGAHLWWSDSDICQTAEDFQDLEKLKRTKEYAQAKGPGRICEIFSQRFYWVKNNPAAQDRILEFFAANFDAVKHDKKKFTAIAEAIKWNFEGIKNNTWGKQLIEKIAKHYSNNALFLIADDWTHQALIGDIIDQNTKASSLLIQAIADNFSTLLDNATLTPCSSGAHFIRKIAKMIESNPKAALSFTQPAIDNLATLMTFDTGIHLISSIIKQNPESTLAQIALANLPPTGSSKFNCLTQNITEHIKKCPQFAVKYCESAINNFPALICGYWGSNLITEIIKQHPQSAAAFAQPALDHFETTIAKNSGIYLIYTIIEQHPESSSLFVQAVADNFPALAANYFGRTLIEALLKQQPKNSSLFIESAINNFSTLAAEHDGQTLISKIIKKHPKSAELFFKPAVDNFSTLAKNYCGMRIINDIIELNPNAVEIFLQPAIEHLGSLSKYGARLIEKLIENNPKNAALFIQSALDNFSSLSTEKFGLSILSLIMKLNLDSINVFQELAEKHANQNVLDIIENLRIKESMAELFQSAAPTQTTQHALALLDHNLKKIENFFPKNKAIHTFKDMVREIITVEDAEQKAGNYTFVHAYPWKIRFLQDIDARLRSIVYNTPLQPLSLRFIKAPHEGIGDKPMIARKDRTYAKA